MANMIARVRNLLLSPKAEWEVIDAEAVEPRKLIFGYVAPLTALPAAATVIGLAGLGVNLGGETIRAPWVWVIASAGLFFALAVLGVVVFAFFLNLLAPAFGAPRSFIQALKVSSYSITAGMVAGLATIVPALGVVALIGAAYSLYLLFLAIPRLMKPSPESATNYSIAATSGAVVIALVVGLSAMATITPSARLLFPQLAGLPGLAPKLIPAPQGDAQASPSSPAKSAGPGFSASAPPTQPAAPDLVSAAALKAIAPEKLVGLDRVSLGLERQTLAGAPSISLDAEYQKGNRYLNLTIANSSQIASLAGFGGPTATEYDRETKEGYSRRQRVGSDVVSEEWDQASQTGSYASVLEGQFFIRAQGGGGVSAAELKQAVESFSPNALAKLERSP